MTGRLRHVNAVIALPSAGAIRTAASLQASSMIRTSVANVRIDRTIRVRGFAAARQPD
jgi:hypothetical protein